MRRLVLFSAVLLVALGLVLGVIRCQRRGITEAAKVKKDKDVVKVKGEFDIQNAFIKVADTVGKSVVAISTERTQKVSFGGPGMRLRRFGFGESPFEQEDPFERFFEEFFGRVPEREYKQKGLGSGFIIDQEGHILTNYHVVEGADKINITLPDGRSFDGTMKGADPRTDLAVLKVNAKNLPVAELGNSDLVQIGEWAVALGNPFGHLLQSAEPTVTSGIISALHRRIPAPNGELGYLDMIQTDAAINVGNSGGPLCDLNGKVIGINVAIFSTSGGYQGIGFAIPINMVKAVLEDLKEGKEIDHGWLGVSIQDVTPEIAEYFNLPERKGVLISEIMPGSPAEKAALMAGDIITAVNGKPVNMMQDLLREIGDAKIGEPVRVDVIRDKIRKSIEVIVGKRPPRAELGEERILEAPAAVEKWRGIRIAGINDNIAAELSLTNKEGVVIIDIEPGSPGYDAGLVAGDVIREINRTKIKNPADYKGITSEAKGLALIRTDRGYFTVKDDAKR